MVWIFLKFFEFRIINPSVRFAFRVIPSMCLLNVTPLSIINPKFLTQSTSLNCSPSIVVCARDHPPMFLVKVIFTHFLTLKGNLFLLLQRTTASRSFYKRLQSSLHSMVQNIFMSSAYNNIGELLIMLLMSLMNIIENY